LPTEIGRDEPDDFRVDAASKLSIVVKAFSYLRVSGKGQVEGDGFPRQRAAVKAYATANGIRIVREFREEGVSGSIENTSGSRQLSLRRRDNPRRSPIVFRNYSSLSSSYSSPRPLRRKQTGHCLQFV
jgi:hypothetical protein